MKAAAEKADVCAEPQAPLEAHHRKAQAHPGFVLEFPAKDKKERRRRKRLRAILSKWRCPTGLLGI
jgi:hypothetical protein